MPTSAIFCAAAGPDSQSGRGPRLALSFRVFRLSKDLTRAVAGGMELAFRAANLRGGIVLFT